MIKRHHVATSVAYIALYVGLMGASLGPAAAAGSGPPASKHLETATFAAGCFWSMQAIFEQLKGVVKAAPGYAGGTTPNPTYDKVEEGRTGYAETVNITFDPRVISYSDLLQVLLTERDPSTVDRQGPDIGNNYRSVIFYHNAEQMQEARAAFAKITAEHLWSGPIVTQLVPFTKFYPAEAYHWEYYARHPNEQYCQYIIASEIKRFRSDFAGKLKK